MPDAPPSSRALGPGTFVRKTDQPLYGQHPTTRIGGDISTAPTYPLVARCPGQDATDTEHPIEVLMPAMPLCGSSRSWREILWQLNHHRRQTVACGTTRLIIASGLALKSLRHDTGGADQRHEYKEQYPPCCAHKGPGAPATCSLERSMITTMTRSAHYHRTGLAAAGHCRAGDTR